MVVLVTMNGVLVLFWNDIWWQTLWLRIGYWGISEKEMMLVRTGTVMVEGSKEEWLSLPIFKGKNVLVFAAMCGQVVMLVVSGAVRGEWSWRMWHCW